MPTWTTPASIYDKCGESASYPASNMIDGDLATFWEHVVLHLHWVKYDLGVAKLVSGIRVYADGDVNFAPCEILEIYVSKSPTSWGSSVGSLTIGTSLGWHQTTFTAKAGRYIYLKDIKAFYNVSCTTHYMTKFYEFAAYCAPLKPKSYGYIFG